MKRLITICLVLVVASSASATPTDLELVLLCDVSGSVDTADFDLIRGGYEAAFRDASIIDRIQNAGPNGSIAASLVYWADSQVIAVDWMLINDEASSNAFADAIAAAARGTGGNTYMAEAMNFAIPLFENDYDGLRQVIDVTGDGADSTDYAQISPNVQAARDAGTHGEPLH